MLCLTIKPDETDVELTDAESGAVMGRVRLIDIRGDRVRLGIVLPRSIRIDRVPSSGSDIDDVPPVWAREEGGRC